MAYVSRTGSSQTSHSWVSTTSGDPLGLVLLGWFYFKLFMTLFPFSRVNRDSDVDCAGCGGGSFENQAHWMLMCLFACFVIYRNWAFSISLLRRSWFILVPLGWLLITMLWSVDSGVTIRRSGLLIVMAIIAFGISAARPSPADFLKWSSIVIGLFLSVSVAGVFLVPHLAKTGSNFAGIYSHKNSAGYVACITVIFWVFFIPWLRQFEHKVLATFGIAVWLFFLIGTSSKTSIGLGLLAPALGVALFYVLALPLAGRALSYIGGALFLALLVFLMLFMNLTIEDIGILIFEDLTFTNRTHVWEFVIRSISERPWLGYGYGAFWNTDQGNLLGAENKGWAEVVTSSHNGYLNIWVEAGLVGLVLTVTALMLTIRRTLLLLKNSDALSADRWTYAVLVAHIVVLILRDTMESGFFKSGASSTALFFMIFFLTAVWRQYEVEKAYQ